MEPRSATEAIDLGLLHSRISEVRARVAQAARRAGRNPSEVTIVAVTKGFPAEMVRGAVACGLRVFGENRVQEARAKIPQVGREGLSWHLVGRLQRNKVKYCFDLFDLIHSVDSLALAREIDRRAEARGCKMDVLLEVNVAGEETKAGVAPEEALDLAQAISGLKNLRLLGLMTMPPWVEDPEESRPHFRALRELAREMERRGGIEIRELSMGMSADFDVAVEEGATLVRIGTAIFGPRET